MTVLRMSEPYLRGAVWWLRIAVPHPLRERAKGRLTTLAVGDVLKPLKVGERITTSLYTSDKAQARQRAGQVRQQAETFFDSLRGKLDPLTHKQRLAFVGEVRQQVVQFFDDDPGDPTQWASVQSIGQRLADGDLRSWGVGQNNDPVELSSDDALLQHYLPAIARAEAKHGIVLTDQERQLLVADLHRAMDDAARVNHQKASGDYSDTGETTRYPELTVSPAARTGP